MLIEWPTMYVCIMELEKKGFHEHTGLVNVRYTF